MKLIKSVFVFTPEAIPNIVNEYLSDTTEIKISVQDGETLVEVFNKTQYENYIISGPGKL